MREIKFRCWDTKNKEWHTPTEWGEEPADAYVGYGEIPEIGSRSNDDYIWMQYTGLKDKNGKEIYESDLVATKGGFHCDEKYLEVYWSDDYGAWCIFQCDHEEELLADFLPVEVIGNIYKNSNLLSQDK